MVTLPSLLPPCLQFPSASVSLQSCFSLVSSWGSHVWVRTRDICMAEANPSLAGSWTPWRDLELSNLPLWIKHWAVFLEAWLSSERLSALFQIISPLALLSPGLSSALQNSESNIINDFDGICYLLAKHIPLGPAGSFQRQSPIDKLPWPNFQKLTQII